VIHHGLRGHDLARLGLTGHAVGGVHGGAEDVAVLAHHRAEVAADPDGDRLLLDFEARVQRDLLLHLGGGVQGIVRRGKGRHDLIAHGLDDGAAVLLGRPAHHLDADPDHVARAQVAKQLVQLGTADDVGKDDGEFDFLSHVPWRIILNRTARAAAV